MNLIHYYRQQFLELTSQFEQTWEEEPFYKIGFLWYSYANAAYKEIFQLTQTSQDPLYLVYAIELSASYKETSIGDVIKQATSAYELACYVFPDKVMVTASVSTEDLKQTSLGFINQARAEMIDHVFSAIQI
ncbi:hypothetical protein [Paenibacillus roseipurpureus]|uniref:Uncharacterized protein n=1 Tax=Paenibacillus roseopurpureus TaxID=2918901 RepID=A0AA96LQX2_9BACL|nr:hypothetical protein [Paenibacillus sp. MBLB1832]WNR45691.1 hypothetical protein MJB10_06210 [Paenibacillus sp. MBLB1832]